MSDLISIEEALSEIALLNADRAEIDYYKNLILILSRIRCEACEKIMEIKPKSLLNNGSLTDGDLGKIMGSNRNLEIIQSIILKRREKE